MATEFLGWSPASQSPPWGLDERVRPEPLPGPASSSFHCFTWTTNPTAHQTTQHWLRKGRGCPIYPCLGLGERDCSKPSKPGIWTPGAPAPATGLSFEYLLWSKPLPHACRTECLPTSLSPRAYLHSALIPPSNTFTELL